MHETGAGCRLTLVGLSYGHGETLQDAADDLVLRVLNLVLCLRSSGFRVPAGVGAPDPRLLDLLWELADLAARGENIRTRLLGRRGSVRPRHLTPAAAGSPANHPAAAPSGLGHSPRPLHSYG